MIFSRIYVNKIFYKTIRLLFFYLKKILKIWMQNTFGKGCIIDPIVADEILLLLANVIFTKQ